MPVGPWTLGLVLGELVAQQSSGRYLALPTVGLEASVATQSPLVFAVETQGIYLPDAFATGKADDQIGSVSTAVSVGGRLVNHQAIGEVLLGPAVRVHTIRIGEFEATDVRAVVRTRLAVGWQLTPVFLARGAVGAWVGLETVDVDATVGVAVCF